MFIWVEITRGRRVFKRFKTRLDEFAGLVLEKRVNQFILLGISELNITDRVLLPLNIIGHTFISLAADTRRPAYAGAGTDLFFPCGGYSAKIVRKDGGRAGTVGTM